MSQRLEYLPWMSTLTLRVLDLWKKQALPHGICLQGCSGLGKRHQCQFLANLLFCEQSQSQVPCGQCRQCIVFNNGEHPDYLTISLTEKGGKIGIDQIRKISNFTLSTAFFAPMRIVVIEPLEQMTLAAANAVLKLLEEPPPNVYFLLASSKISLLMPTIRSRIQFFSISSPTEANFDAWLVNYSNAHKISLTEVASQKLIRYSYQLSQQAPLRALDFLLKLMAFKQDYLPGIPSYKRNPKSTDLLKEFDRFLEVMTQSPSAIRVHLAALLKALSLEESLLFFELWLADQMKKYTVVDDLIKNSPVKNKGVTDNISVLWAGFNAMQSTQESLIRSPSLNISYLQKTMLDQWMTIINSCQRA